MVFSSTHLLGASLQVAGSLLLVSEDSCKAACYVNMAKIHHIIPAKAQILAQ